MLYHNLPSLFSVIHVSALDQEACQHFNLQHVTKFQFLAQLSVKYRCLEGGVLHDSNGNIHNRQSEAGSFIRTLHRCKPKMATCNKSSWITNIALKTHLHLITYTDIYLPATVIKHNRMDYELKRMSNIQQNIKNSLNIHPVQHEVKRWRHWQLTH